MLGMKICRQQVEKLSGTTCSLQWGAVLQELVLPLCRRRLTWILSAPSYERTFSPEVKGPMTPDITSGLPVPNCARAHCMEHTTHAHCLERMAHAHTVLSIPR